MLPYYTKQEIINLVLNKADRLNISIEQLFHENQINGSWLNKDCVWSLAEYKTVARFLDVSLNDLTDMYQEEDLSKVSFRAKENTDEINHHVKKLDDIFTDLAYQIKIGGGSSDGRSL